jgi:hypothetical protein
MDNPLFAFSVEEQLVLEALRRSTSSLQEATGPEIAAYLSDLDPNQLRGVLSNVKGIYHELLFVHAENSDGDEVSARVFDATNHAGGDVEFIVDGETIAQVQLKAVMSPDALARHLERYPDIPLATTDEVASRVPGVASSGFSNADLTRDVADRLDDLKGDSALDEIVEGAGTSALVSAALAAGRMVKQRNVSRADLRRTLGDVVTGSVAATVLDLILE